MALETLPPRFREILVLRELEGCSYKEIAAITADPQLAQLCPRSPVRAASCIALVFSSRSSVREIDFADLCFRAIDGELSGRRAAEFERHMDIAPTVPLSLVDLICCAIDCTRPTLRACHGALRRRLTPPLQQSHPRLLCHGLSFGTGCSCGRTTFCRDLTVEIGHGVRGDDYQAELAGEKLVDAHVRSLQPGQDERHRLQR